MLRHMEDYLMGDSQHGFIKSRVPDIFGSLLQWDYSIGG